MSPRSRESYLADRNEAAEVTRARALHRYFQTHITGDVGRILELVRAARLRDVEQFPDRRRG